MLFIQNDPKSGMKIAIDHHPLANGNGELIVH